MAGYLSIEQVNQDVLALMLAAPVFVALLLLIGGVARFARRR